MVVLGEQTHAFRDLFFDGLLADAQARRNDLLRQLLHPAQPHDLAAALGQPVQRRGEMPEDLPCAETLLRRYLVYQDVQRLEITRRLDRDDAPASQPVGHQVPGGREQEGLGLLRQALRRGLVHAHIDLLAQVVQFVGVRPAAPQVLHEGGLMHEDFANEPGIERRVHRATIADRKRLRSPRREVPPCFVSDAIRPEECLMRLPIVRVLGCALLFALTCFAHAASAAGEAGEGYRYYDIGDIDAARPGTVRPGMLLVGGGDWPYDGFRWFIDRAGHGRIVILRASGDVEAQKEFFDDIGGITAAQTLVFSDRRAASDPRVLAIVRGADGLFLAGGDQANYVRYWKGTPLAAAISEHVRGGKPIAGTSAGLAVLGAHVYGALDGGSQTSLDALADPAGPQSTLVDDFLQLPFLDAVITDSHFDQRARQGRLIAWIARLVHEHGQTDITGLGVDEYTALAIDGDGMARVFSGNGGHVWLFRPLRAADVYAPGKPLSFRKVPATGLGTDSVLHMPQFRVERPAFRVVYDVEAGTLRRRDEAKAQVVSKP